MLVNQKTIVIFYINDTSNSLKLTVRIGSFIFTALKKSETKVKLFEH